MRWLYVAMALSVWAASGEARGELFGRWLGMAEPQEAAESAPAEPAPLEAESPSDATPLTDEGAWSAHGYTLAPAPDEYGGSCCASLWHNFRASLRGCAPRLGRPWACPPRGWAGARPCHKPLAGWFASPWTCPACPPPALGCPGCGAPAPLECPPPGCGLSRPFLLGPWPCRPRGCLLGPLFRGLGCATAPCPACGQPACEGCQGCGAGHVEYGGPRFEGPVELQPQEAQPQPAPESLEPPAPPQPEPAPAKSAGLWPAPPRFELLPAVSPGR